MPEKKEKPKHSSFMVRKAQTALSQRGITPTPGKVDKWIKKFKAGEKKKK